MTHTEPALPLFGDEPPRPPADRLRPRTSRRRGRPGPSPGPGCPARPHGGRTAPGLHCCGGPPGCGKTTIARLLAERTGLAFGSLSAAFSSVADLRKVFKTATRRLEIGQGDREPVTGEPASGRRPLPRPLRRCGPDREISPQAFQSG
ncbi:AAA family ATPase [Streptomyces sp. NBC_00536]|uniref:AAA family ATPase n=1 Tax=Streptomyces sp. NBC_00536 TaxID=2975769 RepID=UPI002E80CC20|nr:AAA family ATPase [Streptomyces sp. NBC_00536]WUC82477.1 AAA family ATPase [Streptomyces sp. NBC_00536]